MSALKTSYDDRALAGGAITHDRARELVGQVMGFVAVTVGFSALGAYLGRDLEAGAGIAFFVGALACIIGLNVAVAKGREQVAIGLLFGLGLLLGLAVAPAIAEYANADPSALWQAAGVTATFVGACGAYGYRDILEFFFQIHDPTTKNRQGYDVGAAYRSEIFATSDEQRQVAEDTIADVEASGLWPGKVVTEITDAVPFWEAEPEHQDYLQHHRSGYTCHFPRPGWKLPHREIAAHAKAPDTASG